MRQRIDITEAEADTKIRGKYLRALENEEWALLPGPTFVKSFLRTYADYLGLDGRTLVEEFKLKYERPEMQAIAPPRPREQGRRGRGSRAGPPGGGRLWIAGALVAVLLIGLFVLGRRGDSGKDATRSAGTTSGGQRRSTTGGPGAGLASVQIIPTGQLYVCLRDAAGRRLLDGVLQPGEATRTYRSSKLRLGLDSGDARLVVNGRARSVPGGRRGAGFAITPTSVTRLNRSDRPSCS